MIEEAALGETWHDSDLIALAIEILDAIARPGRLSFPPFWDKRSHHVFRCRASQGLQKIIAWPHSLRHSHLRDYGVDTRRRHSTVQPAVQHHSRR